MVNKTADADAPVISKSQRKRAAQEMFDLGRRLAELPPARLRELPLDADIIEAVEFARSIKSNVARKRQLGYLARLLRAANTVPVEEALERLQGAAREMNARHHRCEAWRDALLAGGDATLATLAREHPGTEPQVIRQLLRNARREQERGKPPAAARKLFALLRELDETTPLPPIPG